MVCLCAVLGFDVLGFAHKHLPVVPQAPVNLMYYVILMYYRGALVIIYRRDYH